MRRKIVSTTQLQNKKISTTENALSLIKKAPSDSDTSPKQAINDHEAIPDEYALFSTSQELIYARFDHIGEKAMQKLPEAVIGAPKTDEIREIYSDCAKAKITSMPNHGISTTPAPTQFLERVYSDVFGPISVDGNKQYYVSFINATTRYAYISIIDKKSEVFTKFKIYRALVENGPSVTISVLNPTKTPSELQFSDDSQTLQDTFSTL